MATPRLLTYNEILWAKSVFENSLPYEDIYIADYYLPGNEGTPVCHMKKTHDKDSKMHRDYTIYWGPKVYNNGADNVDLSLDTFIHELTHVWQGHNEGPGVYNYMIRSLASQGWAILTHLDRNQAYQYDSKNYLKWSEYNPEQQGNIVRDWFSRWSQRANRGNSSITDPRFVYIDKVIRPGKPYATDIPSATPPQFAQQPPAGFSSAVQAYQRLLIKKGYQIKDDGFNGSKTDKAVRDFQRRNGLKVDGFVGPKTLALLNRP